MNAKILPKLLLMLAIMLTSLSGFADSGSSGSSNPPANGSAVLALQSEYKTIKRMPSRNHLEVVYENGTVTLLSESYEGEFSMNFINCESGICC